ncbi:hypothetical protein PHLCEN_2v5211 [Hermanssonia centrifuga]|uniref:Uncharacterized protein n=1 Tax=Hermanssonia centrifuga TaxID=98765 RepID=A0A2R6P8P3_9APHY|nr:hypothetical protein PHLCEN_2v5211 [Hermanssonia centrifuga]
MNQQLDKLAAARADFTERGMLQGMLLNSVLHSYDYEDDECEADINQDATFNAEDVNGPRVFSSLELAVRPAYCNRVEHIAAQLAQPNLPQLIGKFLYDQLYADEDHSAEDVQVADLPIFRRRVSVYYSAKAFFYAPSKISGTGAFTYRGIRYPCALVQWFIWQDENPDPDTGLWNLSCRMVNEWLVSFISIVSLVLYI